MIYLGKCHGLNWQVLVCLVKYLFWNKIPCGPNAQSIVVCSSEACYGWLRGIPGEISWWEASKVPANGVLDLQYEAEAQRNCQQKRNHCMRKFLKTGPLLSLQSEGTVCGLESVVTVWSCCNNSKYIYLCNTVCFLILRSMC